MWMARRGGILLPSISRLLNISYKVELPVLAHIIYIYILCICMYVCMYIRVVGTNSARSGVLARVNELRLDPRGN